MNTLAGGFPPPHPTFLTSASLRGFFATSLPCQQCAPGHSGAIQRLLGLETAVWGVVLNLGAVMEQDKFSNVSWHSEQDSDVPSGGRTSDAGLHLMDTREAMDAGHAGEILECTVSEPHKENDGTKDAYVSYLITTEVRSRPHSFIPLLPES